MTVHAVTHNIQLPNPVTRRRVDMASLLEEQAEARPEKIFVTMVESGRRLTYSQLNERANQLAHGLAAIGVAAGDFVCILHKNSLEFLIASYALKKIGAVEVAVNAEFRGVGLARMLNLTRSQLLITQSCFVPTLREIRAELKTLASVLLTDQAPGVEQNLAAIDTQYLDTVMSGNTVNPRRQVTDTDLATILFTSGTTGVSKGLMSSHRQAVRIAESVAQAVRLTERDVLYTPWPLFHSGAAHFEILSALLTGGSVVLRSRFSASRFWDETRAFGGTWFMVVGSVQKILWEQPPKSDDSDNPVRIAWGCPFPVDRVAFEERFGLKTLNCYGSSDAGLVSFEDLEHRFVHPSEGKVQNDLYEIRIADERDDPVAEGEHGEILIRPREPDVMLKGYFGMPEVTLEVFRNLWFHTGDIGRIDGLGHLHFLGRRKEVIRRRGENVMPREVEEVVHTHPDIEECVAVGVPSSVGEEDVKVFVVRHKHATLDAESLRAFCRSRMASFMVPEQVEFIDTLPRTPTGKPDLDKLGLRREHDPIAYRYDRS